MSNITVLLITSLLFVSCTKDTVVVKDRECYQSTFDTSEYTTLESIDVNMSIRGDMTILRNEEALKWIRDSKMCKQKYNSLLSSINRFNKKIKE